MTTTEHRASAAINDLPDSAFAYIEPGGTKDSGGKTTPRSKRHFPVHDEGHVRDALARIAGGAEFGQEALPKVKAAARKFGIDVSDAGHSATRDPAWEQRRRRWAGTLLGQRARRAMRLPAGCVEMRAKADGTGGTNFEFFGYGSTFLDEFEMWDRWGEPYDEDVQPGAFTETLAFPGLDVPFLIGHNDAGIPLARTRSGTMHLSEDSHGLTVEALLSGRRSDVRDLADAVDRGDMDEMSIGFVTRGQEWSDDWTKRHLTNVDLHRGDVSVVALAANPATRGVSMTAFPVEALSRKAALERRGNPVDQDLGDASDYNVYVAHEPMTGTHSHAHPGDAEGHAHPHAHDGDADHGHEHLYDMAGRARLDDSGWGADALVRLDDSGIPAMQEDHGAAASLAQARIDLEKRRLVLLGLTG